MEAYRAKATVRVLSWMLNGLKIIITYDDYENGIILPISIMKDPGAIIVLINYCI